MNCGLGLTDSGWPLWLTWITFSLGAAALFVTASPWQWVAFGAIQLTAASLTVFCLRRGALLHAQAQAAAEAPLWRATAAALHDLGTPLHVVRFCIQQWKENPAIAETPKFMEQVTRSAERTEQAFDRLRAFVQAVRDEEGPSTLRTAFQHAVRIVKARFPDRPSTRTLDGVETPDEILSMASGPLVRSLAVLLGGLANETGTISVSVQPTAEQLQIAISSDSKKECSSSAEIHLVRRWVEQWGGACKRLPIPKPGGVGYSLNLARELRG